MQNIFTYKSFPVGDITIGEKNGKINYLIFSDEGESKEYASEEFKIEETELIKKTRDQLEEYFKGSRKEFNIPIWQEGTAFQKKVWKELEKIPYGATRSYKYIAEQIGCPNGSRAVGLANNKNPISIIVPCHRVIGSNGKLVGYGGGLQTKEFLIFLEKNNSQNQQNER